MKSINFTDEELEHIRSYYYIELVEAEKDVERIKTILSKIGEPKPEKPEVIEKKPGKRGRKPKVKVEEVVKKDVKPATVNSATSAPEAKRRGPKPKVNIEQVVKKDAKPKAIIETKPVPAEKKVRSPKVKVEKVAKKEKKVKPIKPVTEEIPVPQPIQPRLESKPDKPIIPKKVIKKKQFKKRGVTLAPLGKPLTKKSPEMEIPPVEPIQEKPE